MNAQDKCRRIAQDCEARAMALPLGDDGCRQRAFYAWIRAAERFIEASQWADYLHEFRRCLRQAAYSVREAKRGALCGTY